MARRLTIRAKLIAGLALVLGISATLTASTLLGLYSYRDSIRKFSSKTSELSAGGMLWRRVAQFDHPSQEGRTLAEDGLGTTFTERLEYVDRALANYRNCINRTLLRGRDPDEGRNERLLLGEIDEILRRLHALPPYKYWELDEQTEERRADYQAFRTHLAELHEIVAKLPQPLHNDMESLVHEAQAAYGVNFWIAGVTGGLVAIMILVLSRLTYNWIFRPIRQLHCSVLRVGEVDLTHRVDFQTGDEMQELAEAFNHMTERLEEVYRDLERQVEDRGRQLVRSEQLASVGFLAAGVAHEINNPLASISLGAESLERRLRRILPASSGEADYVWRYLSMIQSEAFRCKGITEKLLDFSRLRDQERQACSLVSLIADVIDMVQHMGQYREKRIELMSVSDVVAQVNPQGIKQVILNLVVNALDSMDAGGSLQIEVTEQGGYAELVFADDGCGMTPDILRNVFEPFFTRSRSGKGTGLGLSISHRIITDHHGQIEAASDGIGRGSRFTVHLPLTGEGENEEEHGEQIAA